MGLASRKSYRWAWVAFAAAAACGEGSAPAVGPAPSEDEVGAGGGTCGGERSALVEALGGGAGCVEDAECVAYSAPCLQAESGNCAGVFYVAGAQRGAVDALAAAYDRCAGVRCGVLASCGFVAPPPACVDGACAGGAP